MRAKSLICAVMEQLFKLKIGLLGRCIYSRASTKNWGNIFETPVAITIVAVIDDQGGAQIGHEHFDFEDAEMRILEQLKVAKSVNAEVIHF